MREWAKTAFGQRLRGNERLRESWRQTLGGHYPVENEPEWYARANAFIAEHGIAGAFALLMDLENGLSPSNQAASGLQLILSTNVGIRQAEPAGDTGRVLGMWTRMSADPVLRTFER